MVLITYSAIHFLLKREPRLPQAKLNFDAPLQSIRRFAALNDMKEVTCAYCTKRTPPTSARTIWCGSGQSRQPTQRRVEEDITNGKRKTFLMSHPTSCMALIESPPSPLTPFSANLEFQTRSRPPHPYYIHHIVGGSVRASMETT
jgi:hypothetical protein